MDVTEMKNNFIRAQSMIDAVTVEIIKAADTQLITSLQEQLAKGLDGDSRPIVNQRTGRGYASEAYAQHKQNIGSRAPFGTPDLLLTGNMYMRMQIIWIAPDQFSIISNDVKWRSLMRKYGLNTMKLSQTTIQYFIVNRFQPEFIRRIAAITGAGFS